MEAIFRNLPVILVFLTLGACCWIHGGTRPDLLLPVLPWLWALTMEAILCFPQRRAGEDVVSARKRVSRGMRRDPMFYFALVLLVVLVVPFANRGLCQVCDYPLILEGADPRPPVPFAPFCVNASEQFSILQLFLPALTTALAARHALSRFGKRLLVEMFAWSSALMAALGFIQRGTGATAPFWLNIAADKNFFSVFGYPNMGGAFFVFACAVSIGLWQFRVVETVAIPVQHEKGGSRSRALLERFLRAHYALLPVVFNFFGAMCTLCRAALILLFSVVGLAFVYYELSLVMSRSQRAKRIKDSAFVLVGAIVFLIAANVFAPKGLGEELSSLNAYNVADRVAGKAQYHVRVATEIFKEYPFFGVGGWGYRHFDTQFMTPEEMKDRQTVGGANVHNDYMQFLCEHGAVGAGALLGFFLCLVIPLFGDWYRLYLSARFTNSSSAPSRPRAIYCMPAGAFWIIIGAATMLIHAFGDCPLRSAANLTALFCMLSAAEGFIPREFGSYDR